MNRLPELPSVIAPAETKCLGEVCLAAPSFSRLSSYRVGVDQRHHCASFIIETEQRRLFFRGRHGRPSHWEAACPQSAKLPFPADVTKSIDKTIQSFKFSLSPSYCFRHYLKPSHLALESQPPGKQRETGPSGSASAQGLKSKPDELCHCV
eukprot:GHVT01050741.1.p1 GENE.GHVT01050741.1~~GHVT01050741.1.p1  ORF type:complete len:151 (+),score=19.68 GHVT01050741.1:91-543(+)